MLFFWRCHMLICNKAWIIYKSAPTMCCSYLPDNNNCNFFIPFCKMKHLLCGSCIKSSRELQLQFCGSRESVWKSFEINNKKGHVQVRNGRMTNISSDGHGPMSIHSSWYCLWTKPLVFIIVMESVSCEFCIGLPWNCYVLLCFDCWCRTRVKLR